MSQHLLHDLQLTAIRSENMFDPIMEVTNDCSLGHITQVLFVVGGQYRKNM